MNTLKANTGADGNWRNGAPEPDRVLCFEPFPVKRQMNRWTAILLNDGAEIHRKFATNFIAKRTNRFLTKP